MQTSAQPICGQCAPLSALHALVAELEQTARNRFASAAQQDPADDFGRRFIEHGGWCYFNAAQALRKALGLPALFEEGKPGLAGQIELGSDAGLEEFAQRGERPGR